MPTPLFYLVFLFYYLFIIRTGVVSILSGNGNELPFTDGIGTNAVIPRASCLALSRDGSILFIAGSERIRTLDLQSTDKYFVFSLFISSVSFLLLFFPSFFLLLFPSCIRFICEYFSW